MEMRKIGFLSLLLPHEKDVCGHFIGQVPQDTCIFPDLDSPRPLQLPVILVWREYTCIR